MTQRRKTKVERRLFDRIPVQRQMQYCVLNPLCGGGAKRAVTVNMSYSGILFLSEEALNPGLSLELRVPRPNWTQPLMPAQVMRARVVRQENGLTAAEMLPLCDAAPLSLIPLALAQAA